MSIFKGWENHAERLRTGWNSVVGEQDTVVVAGDITWAKNLEQSRADLEFIDRELSGRKVIIRGNHDYWWGTLASMQRYFADLSSISFLHNTACRVGAAAVCGTRGWLAATEEVKGFDESECAKIALRESGRLEKSILAGLELLGNDGGEPIVFLHYPPIHAFSENEHILGVLRKYAIKRVFSGHIHMSGMSSAFIGEKYGTHFDIIAADSLKFVPRKVFGVLESQSKI
jgi:hypothetical protein